MLHVKPNLGSLALIGHGVQRGRRPWRHDRHHNQPTLHDEDCTNFFDGEYDPVDPNGGATVDP